MKQDDSPAQKITGVTPAVGDSTTFVNDKRVPQKIVATAPGFEISVTLKPGQRLRVKRVSEEYGKLKVSFHDDEPASQEDAEAPRRRPPYLRLIRS